MDEEMAVDQTNALEALSSVLTRLTENPYDVTIHAEHVRVAQETGLEEQVEQALEMYTGFWAAGDYVWLPLLDKKLKDADLDSAEGIIDVLALFDKAEVDYLSIPVLKKHIEFLIDRYTHFVETGSKPEGLDELFSTEWTRHAITAIVEKGIGHLTEGQELWNMWQEWEQEVLQQASTEEKAALVPQLDEFYLRRLKEPHDGYESTFQAYSSFTTNYKSPDEYEKLLVQASKMRAGSVKAWSRREPMELGLKQSGYSLEGYNYYITSELKPRQPDLFILAPLLERAIAEADRRRWKGESGAEESLRAFWVKYLDVLRQHDEDEERLGKLFSRATRSIPGSGDIWARYLRFLEKAENETTPVPAAYELALAFPPILKDVEALVQVILSRASYEKRRMDTDEGGEEVLTTLVEVLIEGIAKVRQASSAGDPRLRLEKFFGALCQEQEALQEHAISVWQDAAKHYRTSYLAWSEYAGVLTKHRQYDTARKTYKEVSSKNIDWPEAIWEAWLSFEHLYGSVQEVEECLDRTERARNQVNARRAREAEKAAYAAMQVDTEPQASALISEIVTTSTSTVAQPAPIVSMDVDGRAESPSTSHKRKAIDDAGSGADALESKKARIEDVKPVQLKRDRENSTVFVADLPADTKEEDLKALFKDCGPVREVKITHLPNFLVATVEFMDRDSVPAALTKDKKRVRGQEIAVHLAWKSTLYVTNFPEKADDTFIRELFGKYGVIFDVRWPSKKFRNTRRFCYVQYTSPQSAEAARELHGTEVRSGHPLSVLISNPERKKDRTDSDANDRELYVAGLAKSVTKADIMKVFTTYGLVKDIRLALDDQNKPKGFAFVEFERAADAVAALAANNFELKKRRIAVTVADTRRSNAGPSRNRDADVKHRSVRIKNLPSGAQEGLLQQVLEKRALVKRVEVYAEAREAIAELENAVEAGKLLLHPDPLVFNGNTLQLSEESLSNAPSTAAGLFVPRTAASRPRAGLGSKRGQGGTAISAAATSSASASSSKTSGTSASSKGQDDFRKMLGGA